MSFEIELKARVDAPDGLKNRLSSMGTYRCAYEKDDAYWVLPGNDAARLRLRRETTTDSAGRTGSAAVVTCKTREMRGGVEVNDEQEMAIGDIAVFEKILTRLGLRLLVKKEKRGCAWEFRTETETPILAELSNVTNLGWFIELEILCPVRDENVLNAHRQRLLALLDKLGVPHDAIEPRPYTEMLMGGN